MCFDVQAEMPQNQEAPPKNSANNHDAGSFTKLENIF
jgi:hypothetical protein